MKRKLTNREKILLVIAAVCLAVAILYYAVLKPQLDLVNSLEAQAMEYSEKIKEIKIKANPDNPIYKEYDTLNSDTQKLLKKYYPIIIQEKIILLLDEKIKENEIDMKSISFTEPMLFDINQLDQQEEVDAPDYELQDLVREFYGNILAVKDQEDGDKEENNEEKKVHYVEKMTASLSLEGSYSQIFNFIKDIEDQNRSIICSNISIARTTADMLACDVTLDFYSVPKPFMQDDDYLDWNITGSYGKTNPF